MIPADVAAFIAELDRGRSQEEIDQLNALAKEAISANDARKAEPLEVWVDRLAKDLANFND